MNIPTTWNRCLPVDAGKANYELARITSNQTENPHVFVISRQEVERRDFSRFRERFGMTTKKCELIEMSGKVSIVLDGYDGDGALCTIQPVRDFYLACHKSWPVWPVFMDLKSPALAMIACCVIQDLQILQSKTDTIRIAASQKAMYSFFEQCLPHSALLQGWLNISRREGLRRLQEVYEYLDLPEE